MPVTIHHASKGDYTHGDNMSAKWDIRFLKLATHISDWSKDPSTKVGCVVVGPDREIRSTGFNGFPEAYKIRMRDLQTGSEVSA